LRSCIFIADFYCHELKLIIEIDGEIHNTQKEKDEARSFELQNLGIKIIRFTNEEVINKIADVILKIKQSILEIQLIKNSPK
jgi:very-short-patch-repair endonuclease